MPSSFTFLSSEAPQDVDDIYDDDPGGEDVDNAASGADGTRVGPEAVTNPEMGSNLRGRTPTYGGRPKPDPIGPDFDVG